MKVLAAVAAVVGIILVAGTNARVALGLGLVGLAGYIVVTGMMERLERIEHAVKDLRNQADAERLHTELARREVVDPHSAERQRDPDPLA